MVTRTGDREIGLISGSVGMYVNMQMVKQCKQGANRDLNPCKADPLNFSYSTWQLFYVILSEESIQFYKINYSTWPIPVCFQAN